jgi:hypothetical protein
LSEIMGVVILICIRELVLEHEKIRRLSPSCEPDPTAAWSAITW